VGGAVLIIYGLLIPFPDLGIAFVIRTLSLNSNPTDLFPLVVFVLTLFIALMGGAAQASSNKY
jgi:hypothetical protein